MRVAPELIAPEPITDSQEFLRRARQTFNLGERYLPDVGRVAIGLDDTSGLLREISQGLTGLGDETFRQELADAVVATIVTGDFRHMLAVLAPWFRTFALKHHEDYERAADWARSVADDDAMAGAVDVEEFIAGLGLEGTA